MPRTSRRDELARSALALFVERGFTGASVADIAATLDVSKAAVSYHFPTKDDLLLELVEPVLSELEGVVAATGVIEDEEDLRAFLSRYAAALLSHAEVATWLDADLGVLAHPLVGDRVEALHAATRHLLTGSDEPAAEVAAASALGALWRPVRNLGAAVEHERDQLIESAVAVLRVAAD